MATRNAPVSDEQPPEQSVKDVTPPAVDPPWVELGYIPSDDAPPPYYIADVPLFIDFARAFNPGDQVPVEHVDRYGWHDMVHTPETPTHEPDSRTGQAPTTETDGA